MEVPKRHIWPIDFCSNGRIINKLIVRSEQDNSIEIYTELYQCNNQTNSYSIEFKGETGALYGNVLAAFEVHPVDTEESLYLLVLAQYDQLGLKKDTGELLLKIKSSTENCISPSFVNRRVSYLNVPAPAARYSLHSQNTLIQKGYKSVIF